MTLGIPVGVRNKFLYNFFPCKCISHRNEKKKKQKKNTDTHYVICYIDTDNVYVYVSMSM